MALSSFLDWKGSGYWRFPLTEDMPEYVSPADARLWHEFENLLASARAGRFSELMAGIELYDSCESWVLSAAYVDLLGDAGDADIMRKIVTIAEAKVDPGYQIDMCSILTAWGRLSVIPLLLRYWHELEGYDDREEIPEMLSLLMEPSRGPIATMHRDDPAGYAVIVTEAFERMVAKAGGTDPFVLRGERFSPQRLAELVHKSALAGDLDPYLRRKFEATTGINCTDFYVDGVVHIDGVAAAVDEFRTTWPPEVTDEQRYFFGHPLSS